MTSTSKTGLRKYANVYAQGKTVARGSLSALSKQIRQLMSIFGVDLTENAATPIDDERIKTMIDERNQARAARNFKRSDEIRDELKKQGIILEDTPQGTRYRKA